MLPFQPRHPVVLRTWLDQGLALRTTVVAASPFAQLNWQNPRGREYPIALRSFAGNLMQTTLAPTTITYALHPQCVF